MGEGQLGEMGSGDQGGWPLVPIPETTVVARPAEQGQAVYVCGCCMEVVSRKALGWHDIELGEQVCGGCATTLLQVNLFLVMGFFGICQADPERREELRNR